MTIDDIQKVTVVGAGIMGVPITMVCALANYSVLLHDIHEESLKKADDNLRY
jgi:3-hydroxyacyl-CoA dehydrogenase